MDFAHSINMNTVFAILLTIGVLTGGLLMFVDGGKVIPLRFLMIRLYSRISFPCLSTQTILILQTVKTYYVTIIVIKKKGNKTSVIHVCVANITLQCKDIIYRIGNRLPCGNFNFIPLSQFLTFGCYFTLFTYDCYL